MGVRGAYRAAAAAALLAVSGGALASIGGISGQSVAGCTGCHTANTYAGYTALINGVNGGTSTVAPSSSTAFTTSTSNSGTDAPKAGFNLSVNIGSLTAGGDNHLLSGELTHNNPGKLTSSGFVSWSFTYNAPASVGTGSMFVCINPTDTSGTSAGDGPSDCNVRTIVVNTTPNSNGDSFAVQEDSSSNVFNVLADDTSGSSVNESGDTIEVTHINGVLVTSICPTTVAVTSGTVCRSSTNPGNTLSFTPTANFAGASSFTYQVTDSLGAISAADTVSITVNAVNDAPVATDDAVSVDRNSSNNPVPAAGTVLTNDTDVDSTMSVTQVNGSSAATVATTHGSVTRSGNNLTYTPVASYSGPDSFTYTVSDGSLTDTGTVNVSVNAVAIPDSAPVSEDSADNTIDVLANDTLADAGRTIVSVTAPDQGGTAVIFGTDPNEVIRYTPAPDFFGTETFTYTMTDSSAVQDSALVTVTVTAINDAPQITSGAITAAQDGVPYSYQVGVSDVDDANNGADLAWSLTTSPAGMTVSSTGLIEWTPPINVATGYDVTVRVADGGENGAAAATQSFTIDVSVPDSDSDGMPDSFENLYGFDPNDPADAAQDADGDGLTNLEEYQQGSDPTLDDVAPQVNAPADLVVPSTGYLTVVDLGTGTATDGKDGTVTPTSDWTFPVVRPGRYTVTWTASDLAGNTGTDTQQVDVLPLANLNADQVVDGTGGAATVTVTLNGTPPEYPATIDYTVTGGGPGTFTITSGTSASISIQYINQPAGPVTYTMTAVDQAVIGPRDTHTLTVVTGNAAPTVALNAFQGAFPRLVANQGDGVMTISATTSDPNGDVLSFDWSGSANLLGVDGETTSNASFDPSLVATGVYLVRATVADASTQASAELLVTVAAGTSTDVDIDADGVPDSVDSVTDYGALLEDQVGNPSSAELLEADSGLSLRRGRTSFAAGRTGALIVMSDIVTFGVGEGGLPLGADSFDNVGGIFDFEVHGVAAGGTASVVLPLQTAIREGSVYRKFNPDTGWHDFAVDANNAVASAHSTLGQCPGPSSTEYMDGLQPFNDCVRLTLQDGGPNDSDDAADGVIRDPGGVAASSATPASPSSPVGSGAFLALWLPLAVLLRLRRRAGLAVLALAALLTAAPAQAEHHIRIHYSGDLVSGFDDNVTNAQNDADIRESGFASAAANVDYFRALSLYTTLQLRGSLQGEYWNSFDGLNNGKATGMARVLYRANGDFYTPTLAAWVSASLMEFDSAIRDSNEYRVGVFATEQITTQITGRLALTANQRESDGEVFDLSGASVSLNVDWVPAPRSTIYGGYQYYAGGVTSTATPSLWIGLAAEAIEADDAFGGLAGGLRAYRLDATAQIATLGYNYALTRKLSIDAQGQFITTTADFGNEYERNVAVVSLLARF